MDFITLARKAKLGTEKYSIELDEEQNVLTSL